MNASDQISKPLATDHSRKPRRERRIGSPWAGSRRRKHRSVMRHPLAARQADSREATFGVTNGQVRKR